MENDQNRFYSSVSEHYSEIFPYNPMQLQFLKSSLADLRGLHILDVGCATGELAYQLAEAGAVVTGIDLNEDLLHQARKKNNHQNILYAGVDMLDLENYFRNQFFDAVICFGNTLVHLPDSDSVLQMLNGVNAVLKPSGKFLLQILNYDYILREKLDKLPVIETGNIRFERKYIFEYGSSTVIFDTKLHLKETDEVISNQTRLFALGSAGLMTLLEKSGFNSIEFYAGFNKAPFGDDHLPLVASAAI